MCDFKINTRQKCGETDQKCTVWKLLITRLKKQLSHAHHWVPKEQWRLHITGCHWKNLTQLNRQELEQTNQGCIICPPTSFVHTTSAKNTKYRSGELRCHHDWATQMQPETNHNYLFVVLLQANMNITQKHTHDVWSSSKFHNHSLVSWGYWVPLSRTSSLSFLNDTHTQARAQTHSRTHRM